MSELHLDSLEIKNFRCFEHLTIEKLGRVNLIVGKNSVGKTCLLEAIRLYGSKGNPESIYRLLVDRQDGRLKPFVSTSSPTTLTFDQISDFIFQFDLKKINSTAFEIGDVAHKNYRLIAGLHISDDSEEWNLSKFEQISLDDTLKLTYTQLEYRVQVENNLLKPFRLPITLSMQSFLSAYSTTNYQFISSSSLEKNILPAFWDKLVLEGADEKVLQELKKIMGEIERISMPANPHEPSFRYAVVKLAGVDKPVQLSNLGDGITRIFSLLMAATLSKNGYLLIDEFENGLHYSLQAKVWRFIFQIAQEFNIQVFATTHSEDCIAAFHEAAAENEDKDAMLIRLQKKRDGSGIVAATYDKKSMDVVTRQGIEVR